EAHAQLPELAQQQGRLLGFSVATVELDQPKGRVADQVAAIGPELDQLLEVVDRTVVALERVHAVAAVSIQPLGLALALADHRRAAGVECRPGRLAAPAAEQRGCDQKPAQSPCAHGLWVADRGELASITAILPIAAADRPPAAAAR